MHLGLQKVDFNAFILNKTQKLHHPNKSCGILERILENKF